MGVSVGLMVAMGALGPSAIQPRYGSPTGAPPWFVVAHPPDLLIYAMVVTALLLGAAGVGATLLATREGWGPRPAWLFAGGVAATAVLLLVPSMGTTDVLHYAASGRIAALGADPYAMTPADLAATGDPVGGRALADMWDYLPSNYGPLATATQWATAELGGVSTLRIVWLNAVLNGAGFVATGLLLDRLAGPHLIRRIRAQLAWTLNPVLLWQLVVGAHVDGLAVLAAAGALAALTLRRAGMCSGALAGAAIAAACATKISYAVLIPGLVWALRHDKPRLTAGLAGGSVVLVAAYAPFFPQALVVPLREGTRVMGASSWAPFLEGLLNTSLSPSEAKLLVTIASALAFALLAAVLARGLPAPFSDSFASHAVRPAAVVVVAWLFTTPHAAPWYDVMAWILVPLLPLSWIGPALLAHTTLLSFGYIYLPTGGEIEPAWLAELASLGLWKQVVPLGLTAVACGVVGFALRGRIRRPLRRLAVQPADPPART